MNLDTIEKRDQDVRSSLAEPTLADRDRRALLASIRRMEEAMREALSYLRSEEGIDPKTDVAIEALTYALEQG